MRKLQNTLAQLNESNFDILNSEGMEKLKGGCRYVPSCCSGGYKSKKSKKSRKVKSVKSIKTHTGGVKPCGW